MGLATRGDRHAGQAQRNRNAVRMSLSPDSLTLRPNPDRDKVPFRAQGVAGRDANETAGRASVSDSRSFEHRPVPSLEVQRFAGEVAAGLPGTLRPFQRPAAVRKLTGRPGREHCSNHASTSAGEQSGLCPAARVPTTGDATRGGKTPGERGRNGRRSGSPRSSATATRASGAGRLATGAR